MIRSGGTIGITGSEFISFSEFTIPFFIDPAPVTAAGFSMAPQGRWPLLPQAGYPGNLPDIDAAFANVPHAAHRIEIKAKPAVLDVRPPGIARRPPTAAPCDPAVGFLQTILSIKCTGLAQILICKLSLTGHSIQWQPSGRQTSQKTAAQLKGITHAQPVFTGRGKRSIPCKTD